jgi:hypothetical protein
VAYSKQQRTLKLESRVAFGRPVCYLILLAKTVGPDGRRQLLTPSSAGAETPGSRDTYQVATDPKVSTPAEAVVKSCFRLSGL